MPLVSIIIPTYNRERFVTKAIDSVLKQSYGKFEIIVVDDGSTDDTREAVKAYADKIVYIYQDNSGVSAARNTGIKHARGEWLAFLDSDDEWRSDYLYTQMNNVNNNSGIIMQTADCTIYESGGSMLRYFEINGALAEFRGKEYLYIQEPFLFVIKHGPWQVGSTIILREAIKKAGLFDEGLQISEDYDLMARVSLLGSLGIIRKELTNVHRRQESIVCLTHQAKENPIPAREADERVYEKLHALTALKQNQRSAILEIMRANRSAIGNMQLKTGNMKAARESYRRAVSMKPSVRSFGKYILSFLPSKYILRAIEKNSEWKARRKSRSSSTMNYR
jgi:hypothetical protein